MPDVEGAVARGIIDHQDFAVVVLEDRLGNALEDTAQGGLRVVRDDKNAQTGTSLAGHGAWIIRWPGVPGPDGPCDQAAQGVQDPEQDHAAAFRLRAVPILHCDNFGVN
jgi:hypothetical protein